MKPFALKTTPARTLADGEAPSLAAVTTTTKRLPNRAVLHAVQKWGKTSFAAQSHKPIFIMTRGEDGLLTLMDNGQVPATAHFPDPVQTWLDLKLAIGELIVQPHDYKTLVLDTINGVERLAHEHLVHTEMGNDWEKFDAFGRGPKLAVKFMVELTTLLDRVRAKGMSIILLCHSQVKTFNNPEGDNYDRWEPVLDKAAWAHIDRWVDMILFGNFVTVANAEKGASKAKAHGGSQRLLCTQRTAAYDAGNRHGLPEELNCGNSPQEAWANFAQALKAGRVAG